MAGVVDSQEKKIFCGATISSEKVYVPPKVLLNSIP